MFVCACVCVCVCVCERACVRVRRHLMVFVDNTLNLCVLLRCMLANRSA